MKKLFTSRKDKAQRELIDYIKTLDLDSYTKAMLLVLLVRSL